LSLTSRNKPLDGENPNNQTLEHRVNISDTLSRYAGSSRQIGPNRGEGFLISEPWPLPQTKTEFIPSMKEKEDPHEST